MQGTWKAILATSLGLTAGIAYGGSCSDKVDLTRAEREALQKQCVAAARRGDRPYTVTITIEQITDGKKFTDYVKGHFDLLKSWGGDVAIPQMNPAAGKPPDFETTPGSKENPAVTIVQSWPRGCFQQFFYDAGYNPSYVHLRYQSTIGTAKGSDECDWGSWSPKDQPKSLFLKAHREIQQISPRTSRIDH